MKGKRTNIDFSEHELSITDYGDIIVHKFKKPGTVYHWVKFVNTDEFLAVTGDFGNWIFCRPFVPHPGGGVSDSYWVQKLKIHSRQNPTDYDPEGTEDHIQEILDSGEIEGEPLREDEREFLEECQEYCSSEHEFIYNAHFQYQSIPDGWDHETISAYVGPQYRLDIQLQAVFDAFEAMCTLAPKPLRKMTEDEARGLCEVLGYEYVSHEPVDGNLEIALTYSGETRILTLVPYSEDEREVHCLLEDINGERKGVDREAIKKYLLDNQIFLYHKIKPK